jgi:hypothetical protein
MKKQVVVGNDNLLYFFIYSLCNTKYFDMKKEFLIDTLVLLIAFTFCTIFWQERMGVNALLFSLLLLGCLLLRYDLKRPSYFWISAAGTIIAATMVVWHNSLVSKVIYFASMVSMIGFAQHRVLRFVWYAWLMGLYSMWQTPRKFLHQLKENIAPTLRPVLLMRNLQLAFFPFVVVGLFYIIYYFANGKFAELSHQFWVSFWEFIVEFFPLQRLLLFVIGGFIAGGALWRTSLPKWIKAKVNQTDFVQRYRQKKATVLVQFGILDLKKEYQQAIAILATLNVLLFIVNIIDVRYVWFNFEVLNAYDMRQYVHEGTYLLIAAILLAMTILLIAFRGNLNFFSKNGWMKRLAYLWIAQNGVLALSVAVRNIRYVEHYQLAYKRIGVFIFLALVLFGLLTLVFKIKDKKNLFYVLRTNALASYCVWIVVCCINWDVFITKYNLAHYKSGVDTYFLIEKVSDKNLFVLEREWKKLLNNNSMMAAEEDIDDITKRLRRKRKRFEQRIAKGSWLSWNYSDWRNKQQHLSRRD